MKKILFALIVFAFNNAIAANRIDITRGNMDPMPIAINDFIGEDADDISLARELSLVIEANLERSGFFRIIDKAAFIEHIKTKEHIPTFALWRQINANVFTTGAIKVSSNGDVEVEFRLWDATLEQQIAGRKFSGDIKMWRRMAHKISDEIYKRLTGEEGYFDTRIAYIAESGPGQKRVKRVAIMDQDGENHQFLTNGKNLTLTPRFSPKGDKLLYSAYVNRKLFVYMMDINTKRERLIGNFPGMNFSPIFSPDGNSILISVAYSGNTDIYSIDLATNAKTRLTNDYAIDVSPSYSPDGKKIVFNSDRGGNEQLYMMDADGKNSKRISFGSGNYTTPVWSPRGDLIAFTKKTGKTFSIGVMRTDGSGERILTDGYLVESPSWSPNGQVLLFERQEPSYAGNASRYRIYSINISGYNEREVITPIDASDPDWSPLLP